MPDADIRASAAERQWLAGVLVIAVALRAGAALLLGNAVGERMPGLADQLSYHTLAIRVTEGHGFSFGTGWWPATPAGEPTAHWSFLYTILLSAIYWVVGPQPLAVRLLQAVVVGGLHPYLSWRIGRRLFGPRVALASALIVATYAYFVYYAAALMTEALYLVGILWVIDVAMRIADGERRARGSVWLWFWLGLAIAGTVLLRQVFLLCVPLVIVWIAVRQVTAARGLGLSSGLVLQRLASGAALAALVVVLCVLPVTLRNYRAFARFVPINTNAGFALFWGNHPVHGDRYMPLLRGDGSEYGKLIPEELHGLDEAALDRALLVRGAAFVTADPGRYLRLCLGRVREYFKFWPSPESGAVSNVVRTVSFGLFLPFMLGGIALAIAGRHPGDGGSADDRGAALLPLVVAAGYTLIHVMIWALVRYRLPVDALLVPFAGVSAMWIVDRHPYRAPRMHGHAQRAVCVDATPPPVPRLSLAVQSRLLTGWLMLSDAAALLAAFTIAYWVRFDLQITIAPEVVPHPAFYPLLASSLPVLWLAVFFAVGLYDAQKKIGGLEETARAFNACTTAAMLVIVATFLQPDFVVSRMWLVSAWLLSFLAVATNRFLARRLVAALRQQGFLLRPAILVGMNEESVALATSLNDWRSSGVRLVGVLASSSRALRHEVPGVPLLGSSRDVAVIVTRLGIEDVVVAITAVEREELLLIGEDINPLPHVSLRLSSGLYELLTTRVTVQHFGTLPLLRLDKIRLAPVEALLKTTLEYSLTTALVILLAPVLLAIAVLIALDSPGPVLYRRRVLGGAQAPFDAFKFRTMHVDGDARLAAHPEALAALKANHKLQNDPRVTRTGRWLRMASLDELPQLFNVLRAEMSLVGPRMITPEELEKYGRLGINLHTVKPGITGLWQVSGRSDLSYEERVRLDMYYVRNYSIWMDLQILFVQTIPAVLKRRGAY